MHFLLLVFLVIAAAITANAGAADIHKWRDADGNLHFGDRPPAGVESTQITVKPNVYSSPTIERLAEASQQPDEVVLYSTTWCGYCKQAKAYFDAEGIAYSEYDVETSAKGQRDYKRLGAHGVPVILVGDQRMNGFSVDAFLQLLADAKR